MGGDGTGSAGVTLFVVVLVVASAGVVSAIDVECPSSDGYSLERGDGVWLADDGWVLNPLTSGGGSPETSEGPNVDEKWPTATPDSDARVSVEAFTRGPAGDWWVVGDDGRVVRFTRNWSATGE
jgi:hypothetical protein